MIGVFDSGLGGLSVLTRIREVLPLADLVYVADRARSPYGIKSLEEVEAIALEVTAWLVDRGADTVVVACNTASAAALETIRAAHPSVPIVGMEPAVKPAARISRTGTVAVFATAATFQGRLFESLVSRFGSGLEIVTRACPEWVEFVERGRVDDAEVESSVRRAVDEVIGSGADVLVLGCTHFSFLGPLMSRLGDVTVIDPAPAVAAQTARVAADPSGTGELSLAASGDTVEFRRLASALAGIDSSVIPFGP